MGTVVVDVMLKSEILDPQGQAVAFALPRLGFDQFTDVRQGKRFELTVEGEVTDQVLAAARQAAETMLSNPVIEDVVSVRAEPPVVDPQAAGTTNAESDVEFLA
jgi:phosphoribosylformylglycinamidine synthase